MTIKTLTKSQLVKNLEAILKIDNEQMGKGVEVWSKDNFLSELPKKYQLSRIVLENSNCLGYLIASLRHNVCHIHRIGVRVSYTGLGIGSAMIRSLDKKCQKLKIKKIFVESLSDKKLSKFYLKNNFNKLPKKIQKDYSECKDERIRQEFLKNYYIYEKIV